MKHLRVLLIVVVLAIATVVTAFAAGPIIEPFDYDDTYALVYCGGDDIGVGDFWIMNNEVGSGIDKFWNDKIEIYRHKFHVGGVDHLFAALDPDDPDTYSEHVVTGHFAINGDARFDQPVPFPPWFYEPTRLHVSGNQWNIQLPGYGNVFHVTLNAKFEYGEWVREASLEVVDFENMCQYFDQFAP